MRKVLEREEFAKKIMIDRLNDLINETKQAAAKLKNKGLLTLDDAERLKGMQFKLCPVTLCLTFSKMRRK